MKTQSIFHQNISDADLLALAALVNVEAVLMAGDNAAQIAREGYPVWTAGAGFPPATTKLRDELYFRKILI